LAAVKPATRRNQVRRSPMRDIPVTAAKAKVLDLLANGAKIAEAMHAVDRKAETYRSWRQDDPSFDAEVRYLRTLAERTAKDRRSGLGAAVPDFPTFCRDYLGQPLYEHQLRMWDLLCGKAPRDLHPSMVYRPGRLSRILCNWPPDHGKTATISINFVTWLIHRNPDVRVVLVSKTQGMARKMLGAIKFRLTDASYRPMHLRFAPQGGWKDPDQSWTQTEIYVKGRGSGEKDPTVQAIGISGHIQGARSDWIILDDAVDRANASQWEAQTDWLAQIITSRLPNDDEELAAQADAPGKLVVLGTRNAPKELYQVLRDDFQDYEGNPVWTYFSQPAVLDYGPTPADWRTLWPYTEDAHGVRRRKWDGPALAKRRGDVRSESLWALTFQQQDVAENAVFPQEVIAACTNGARGAGDIPEGGMGASRGDKGMTGLYVVAGLDPATVGHTAMLVYGVDRLTRRRFVLDGVNQPGMTPHELRSAVKRLTREYKIREWRVERNAFQRFLTQDEELRMWLANQGCLLREHFTTGKNKWDPDFGIAGLAALFLSSVTPDAEGRWRKIPGGGLVELPSPRLSPVIAELVDQLVTWQPETDKSNKTDLVMALWFAEVAAREFLGIEDRQQHHLPDPFASRHDLARQTVVDLNVLAEEQFYVP
jgi:hypothetical protein